MKTITFYQCETCGITFYDFKTIERHEANHLGLSVDEMHEYKSKKSRVDFTSFQLSLDPNNKCIKDILKEYKNDLINYELAHDINENP